MFHASLHQAAYVRCTAPGCYGSLPAPCSVTCLSNAGLQIKLSNQAQERRQLLTEQASAGEVPLCDTSNSKCIITDPAKHPALFCTTDKASSTNCQRYQEFHSLYSRGTDQHTRDLSHAQEKSNSVVFNCFIFFQVCPCCLVQKLHK